MINTSKQVTTLRQIHPLDHQWRGYTAKHKEYTHNNSKYQRNNVLVHSRWPMDTLRAVLSEFELNSLSSNSGEGRTKTLILLTPLVFFQEFIFYCRTNGGKNIWKISILTTRRDASTSFSSSICVKGLYIKWDMI